MTAQGMLINRESFEGNLGDLKGLASCRAIQQLLRRGSGFGYNVQLGISMIYALCVSN